MHIPHHEFVTNRRDFLCRAGGGGGSSLEDTLKGKIEAWKDAERRQSKRIKDLGDIARLTEAHPQLWEFLPDTLQQQIERPREGRMAD